MRIRVYETVKRPSANLSRYSIAAAACGWFAAERPAGRRYRSIAARRLAAAAPQHGAQQQT